MDARARRLNLHAVVLPDLTYAAGAVGASSPDGAAANSGNGSGGLGLGSLSTQGAKIVCLLRLLRARPAKGEALSIKRLLCALAGNYVFWTSAEVQHRASASSFGRHMSATGHHLAR
eukprot:364556-Chlamydomonas_euryale.AAC.11